MGSRNFSRVYFFTPNLTNQFTITTITLSRHHHHTCPPPQFHHYSTLLSRPPSSIIFPSSSTHFTFSIDTNCTHTRPIHHHQSQSHSITFQPTYTLYSPEYVVIPGCQVPLHAQKTPSLSPVPSHFILKTPSLSLIRPTPCPRLHHTR